MLRASSIGKFHATGLTPEPGMQYSRMWLVRGALGLGCFLVGLWFMVRALAAQNRYVRKLPGSRPEVDDLEQHPAS